jgi:hypothetical protein
VNAWREFGFPDLKVGDPASEEWLDALVRHGAPAQIAQGVAAHLEAGADHVAVQVLPHSADPIPGLTKLVAELGLCSG